MNRLKDGIKRLKNIGKPVVWTATKFKDSLKYTVKIVKNSSRNTKIFGGSLAVYYITIKSVQMISDHFIVKDFSDKYQQESKKISEKQQEIVDDIHEILIKEDWDYGHIGPALVRLAWHISGTYDIEKGTGGSNGSTIRFDYEKNDPANAGLDKVMELLEPIKQKHPDLSYADLYILASYVAIKDMGGPDIPFRFGRFDRNCDDHCPANGLLPDATQGAKHIREIFNRMDFNDQEMVVLIGGGHTIGKCHKDRSGYEGPWTFQPTSFTNFYFREIMDREWKQKEWDGPTQYEDPTGKLMMLPTDMQLKIDPKFNEICQLYQNDSEKFMADFAKAYKKLTENGCFDYYSEYYRRSNWNRRTDS